MGEKAKEPEVGGPMSLEPSKIETVFGSNWDLR